MKYTVLIARVLLTLFGLLQIVTGGFIWSARELSLLLLHMLLGVLFVVCLWVLVGVALSARRSPGFALAVFVWGLIVGAFGVAQPRLLLGSLHWLIQSIHLLIGLIAIGLGHVLAARITGTRSPAAPSGVG